MRNGLDKRCRENENTHFIYNNFFRKSCCLWDNVEKWRGAWETTNYVTTWRIRVARWINKACTAYAPEHPHARTSTHTQICNTCSSKAIVVSTTRLNATLNVRCLSFLLYKVWISCHLFNATRKQSGTSALEVWPRSTLKYAHIGHTLLLTRSAWIWRPHCRLKDWKSFCVQLG